jgi:hypothetical protein
MSKVKFSAMLLLASIVALGTNAIAQSQQELAWKPWDEWDRATKSYAPIDSTIESRKDIFIAKAVLNPELPPFIFVHRRSSGHCGSGGCALEVLAPDSAQGGKYVPFQQWIVDEIQIKSDQIFDGWHPILLGTNTWVYDNGQYTLR